MPQSRSRHPSCCLLSSLTTGMPSASSGWPFPAPLQVHGVQLTHRLDAELGRPNSITLSLRDVPGLTRSTVCGNFDLVLNAV